jgi:hypothetical protein
MVFDNQLGSLMALVGEEIDDMETCSGRKAKLSETLTPNSTNNYLYYNATTRM